MFNSPLLFCAFIVTLTFTSPLRAQILQGEWVDQSQRAIAEHRMTDAHVIVLDLAGAPAAGAKVHFQMRRHAFAFGVVLDARDFADASQPVNLAMDAPVWRCFSAVALDDAGNWPAVQPDKDAWDFRAIDRMIAWSEAHGLATRWGGVTSADPGAMPPWVVQLDDAGLRRALELHVQRVMTDYGRRIEPFDLHTNMVDHKLVAARLGMQMVRRLHESAQVIAPRAKIGLRFENCLIGPRLRDMANTVTDLRQAFVPFDTVVFDEKIGGTVLQAPLARAMTWLRDLDAPVVIGRLEVAGSSPTGAAVNMETLLRVLFAEPAIDGIYLAGIRPDQAHDPSAALLDAESNPTAPGELFDALVHKLWWTDVQAQADELGNVRQRIFAGTYRITATLADGTVATSDVYLPHSQQPRTLVLQPIAVNAALSRQ